MSIINVNKNGLKDDYLTPKYVVEILLPYLKQTNIKTIWTPFDKKKNSEYVKVLINNGYKVINSHIDNGEDFFKYKPKNFDAIISNPPFSKKNDILKRCIELDKPFAILLSATCIQSASLINIIAEAKEFYFILFDKRISYNGDRPPFPSWYFTSKILNSNKFYIYKENPKILYKKWLQK